MSEPNFVQSTAKSIMNSFRASVPALSFLDDTGIILLGYLIAWAVIHLVGLLLSDSSKHVYLTTFILFLESPDALDRRAFFDTRTKLKEKELEIENMRKLIPDENEQDQLLRNYQALQQRLYDEQQTVQSLCEQLIDPEILAEKDRTIAALETSKRDELAEKDRAIAALETSKRDELAQLKQAKDAEVSKLRSEVDKLSGEVRDRQKE
jgi:hypothetical protein